LCLRRGHWRPANQTAKSFAKGLKLDRLRDERATGQPVHIRRDIETRAEQCSHLGQEGQHGVAQRESVGRGEIDFRNEKVATSAGIDPGDGVVGTLNRTGLGKPEFDEHF
jgi:hypothetical protein